MRTLAHWSIFVALVASADSLWADGQRQDMAAASQETTLTGEVVALWCLLREGGFGTGRENHSKQVNCIQLGSPIAIRAGETFYVASAEDRAIKSRLTNLAGHRVLVRGTLTEHDSQSFIAVSHIERAEKKGDARQGEIP
jgi:hypothetical protein